MFCQSLLGRAWLESLMRVSISCFPSVFSTHTHTFLFHWTIYKCCIEPPPLLLVVAEFQELLAVWILHPNLGLRRKGCYFAHNHIRTRWYLSLSESAWIYLIVELRATVYGSYTPAVYWRRWFSVSCCLVGRNIRTVHQKLPNLLVLACSCHILFMNRICFSVMTSLWRLRNDATPTFPNTDPMQQTNVDLINQHRAQIPFPVL